MFELIIQIFQSSSWINWFFKARIKYLYFPKLGLITVFSKKIYFSKSKLIILIFQSSSWIFWIYKLKLNKMIFQINMTFQFAYILRFPKASRIKHFDFLVLELINLISKARVEQINFWVHHFDFRKLELISLVLHSLNKLIFSY